jgi:hypothetical protein
MPYIRLGRIVLAGIIFISILAGCRNQGDVPEGPVEILFVGDSFTSYPNTDLPEMFTHLAELGGHEVNVSSITRSATSLAFHSRNKNLMAKINEGNLDYIVLQETEKIPSVPEDRDQYMFPIVRELNSQITDNGAQTILYMTWGYKDGFPQAGHETYVAMQNAIAESNMMIANELDIPVAPVGIAWQTALERDPNLDLWLEDGGHATVTGMYLSANVFYAVIFGKSPLDLPYSDKFGIDEETTRFIQQVASEVVLENPENWNIDQLR